MDTPDPTTATAMDMEMEPGMLSTTTQQGFILTMAAMETEPCQTRWGVSAWVPHTGDFYLFIVCFILNEI